MADTHLGFRQLHRVNDAGRNEREQDVYDAFEQAISKVIEIAPDAVVHSGDLFDSYHPSSAALRIALDGFRRVREAGIPIVVIAGNHSTPASLPPSTYLVCWSASAVCTSFSAVAAKSASTDWLSTRLPTTTTRRSWPQRCTLRGPRRTPTSMCWSPMSVWMGWVRSSAPRLAR